jgi:ribosomal-protein-alanine N-acetyltransferase
MTEDDLDALMEITDNENVYRFVPPFLFRKSRETLRTAIRNLAGRDFEKKKCIIAGIYMADEPDRLIGLAEIFDYKKRSNQVTVGYRLNEKYWNRGVATGVIAILKKYLLGDMRIGTLMAFVMPENTYSSRALLKNGFVREQYTVTEKNWGGREEVTLEVYTCRDSASAGQATCEHQKNDR